MLDPNEFVGRWLTKTKAALWVDVAESTIRNWIRQNKVQWQYTAGGGVRVWEPSLWKAQRESQSTDVNVQRAS